MSAFETVAVDEKPGGGSIFVGVAAQSFATGPTLMLLFSIYSIVFDGGTLKFDDLQDIPRVVFFSSLICLIGSIPAASVNAIVLGASVRKNLDVVWWAMFTGGVIGLLTAAILVGLFTIRQVDGGLALWFFSTGALMGALHWFIAIRPRRRWRHRMMRDAESIKAME